MSYRNWKHILSVFKLWKTELCGVFVILLNRMGPIYALSHQFDFMSMCSPRSLSHFFFPLQTHSSHLLSSLDLHKSITHRHMSITCHLHKLITLCHHKHHRTSKLKCQKHKSDPFTRLGHAAGSRHLHRPITYRHHEHYNITKLENSIQALWILAGFGFVFWKSNRGEGGNEQWGKWWGMRVRRVG